MKMSAYKATGLGISAAKKLLGVKLRITGAENIANRPTVFVVNHFTRLETLIVPYAIYHACRRPVHCLAADNLFQGALGRYLNAVGVVSIRDPRRNLRIVSDLMTGNRDWVIYPEGGLIKNKKFVKNGELYLTHPHHTGPPHTGAAVLALKAEIAKRRYRLACDENDPERREYYETRYGISSPEQVKPEGIVITPVNITFYPLRHGNKAFNRLAEWCLLEPNDRMQEELEVEGSILLGKPQVSVHFCPPIEVTDYLGDSASLSRKVFRMFSQSKSIEVMVHHEAAKLTQDSMRSVYNSTEINIDHLFCAGLSVLKSDTITVEDFHRALYLTATQLNKMNDVRLHPGLTNGIAKLVTTKSYDPIESVIELAAREGVLKSINGSYVIDRTIMITPHEFHSIRVNYMSQVIANELEPVDHVMELLKHNVNLPSRELKRLASETLRSHDHSCYKTEHVKSEPTQNGTKHDASEPFFMENPESNVGVVLAHGYLACPEQMKPLAEFLYSHGLSVYGVRLAGHGTSPDNLANVTWADWIDSIRRGYGIVKQHHEHVIVGGFSLGGLLAAMFAAEQPRRLAGLFTINAPFKIRDRRLPILPFAVRWNALLRKLGVKSGQFYRSIEGSERPTMHYESDDVRSIHQLWNAMRSCRRRLNHVKAPTLVIQSDHDPVVSPRGAEYAINHLGSKTKLFAVVPSDKHTIVTDDQHHEICRPILRFIQRLQFDIH